MLRARRREREVRVGGRARSDSASAARDVMVVGDDVVWVVSSAVVVVAASASASWSLVVAAVWEARGSAVPNPLFTRALALWSWMRCCSHGFLSTKGCQMSRLGRTVKSATTSLHFLNFATTVSPRSETRMVIVGTEMRLHITKKQRPGLDLGERSP